MPHPPPNILLVTPVWNDSARLAGYGPELATVLAATAFPIRWIIADDGSEPSEHARLAELLEEFAAVYPQVTLHFAAAHYGKGSVIREAWALDSQVGWLAFVDADGAVSAAQIVGLSEAAVAADRAPGIAQVPVMAGTKVAAVAAISGGEESVPVDRMGTLEAAATVARTAVTVAVPDMAGTAAAAVAVARTAATVASASKAEAKQRIMTMPEPPLPPPFPP